MLKVKNKLLIAFAMLTIFVLVHTEPCNEGICGSIVSKCILTQSCECAEKDSLCYRDCVACMGKKYFEECCDCVDLCPKLNHSTKSTLSQKSHVEDFEGVPELFDVLVSAHSDDLEYRWSIFTFSVDFGIDSSKHNIKADIQATEEVIANCTVVYFDGCISWNKCRQSCRSTGASSYRWFHDGCCECVGSSCINYGVNESRCRYCPEEDDEDEKDANDYNEDLYEFEVYDGNLEDNSV